MTHDLKKLRPLIYKLQERARMARSIRTGVTLSYDVTEQIILILQQLVAEESTKIEQQINGGADDSARRVPAGAGP